MLLADKKTKASPDAMRKAAKILGVTVPKTRGGSSDQELLGNLRIEMSKRLALLPENEQVICAVCQELATDDVEFCPYCGDLGPMPEQLQAEIIPGSGAGVGIAKTPVPISANVSASLKAVERELDAVMKRIIELKHSAVDLSYDMGVECKKIRDQKLYTARGHKSFKDFAQKELPFTRESALQLISIAEKYSREDYAQIGYAKLRVISAVSDTALKADLTEAARSGASVKVIAERARRTSSNPKKPTVAPEKGEKITLIGKIGARGAIAKFHNVETGEVMENAGVFKTHLPNSYGEIEIADGVFVRVGLRVSAKNELEGLTIRFVRASDETE